MRGPELPDGRSGTKKAGSKTHEKGHSHSHRSGGTVMSFKTRDAKSSKGSGRKSY